MEKSRKEQETSPNGFVSGGGREKATAYQIPLNQRTSGATLSADTDALENGSTTDPEKGEVYTRDRNSDIVDWDGPNDPEMALNWSQLKKWINVLSIASLTLLTPFGSSMFAPGVPQMMEEFNSTNNILGILSVSIYVLGYAFGPLFLAPLSELYGRLPLYHSTTGIFILMNVACAKSTSIEMLVVFRFLAGLVGSCPLTVGPGSITDCFKQEERGFVVSVWTLPVLLGPTVGPVAGGYLTDYLGWRSNFWFLVISTGVAWLLCIILLRETHPATLLHRRTVRLQKSTSNPQLHSALASSKSPTELLLTSIARPTKMLIFSPTVFALSLYTALNYGFLYLLFTTMTQVFERQYDFSPSTAGLTYLAGGAGQVPGLIVFGLVSDRLLLYLAKKKGGDTKPEYRLPMAIIGAFLVPLGLLWYGWTAQYRYHWALPVVGTFFVGLGMILIFSPVGLYLVDAFPEYAASATAANTVLRSLGGALLPLCGDKMYDSLGLGWGNSLLAFIGVACIPFVWGWYLRGDRVRLNPRFQMNL